MSLRLHIFTFFTFSSKSIKRDFLRFLALLYTFSRTMVRSLSFSSWMLCCYGMKVFRSLFTTWKGCFVFAVFSPSSTIWHCSSGHRCLSRLACLCTAALAWQYARLSSSVRDLLALRLLRLSTSLSVSSVIHGLLVLSRLFSNYTVSRVLQSPFHLLPKLIWHSFLCGFC